MQLILLQKHMCSSTGKVTGNNVTGRKVKYRRVILKGMYGRGHF